MAGSLDLRGHLLDKQEPTLCRLPTLCFAIITVRQPGLGQKKAGSLGLAI